MGHKETYEYINDNPAIEFKTVDITNNPLVIAQHKNMTAINSALEIDLTGQASANHLGIHFIAELAVKPILCGCGICRKWKNNSYNSVNCRRWYSFTYYAIFI